MKTRRYLRSISVFSPMFTSSLLRLGWFGHRYPGCLAGTPSIFLYHRILSLNRNLLFTSSLLPTILCLWLWALYLGNSCFHVFCSKVYRILLLPLGVSNALWSRGGLFPMQYSSMDHQEGRPQIQRSLAFHFLYSHSSRHRLWLCIQCSCIRECWRVGMGLLHWRCYYDTICCIPLRDQP